MALLLLNMTDQRILEDIKKKLGNDIPVPDSFHLQFDPKAAAIGFWSAYWYNRESTDSIVCSVHVSTQVTFVVKINDNRIFSEIYWSNYQIRTMLMYLNSEEVRNIIFATICNYGRPYV